MISAFSWLNRSIGINNSIFPFFLLLCRSMKQFYNLFSFYLLVAPISVILDCLFYVKWLQVLLLLTFAFHSNFKEKEFYGLATFQLWVKQCKDIKETKEANWCDEWVSYLKSHLRIRHKVCKQVKMMKNDPNTYFDQYFEAELNFWFFWWPHSC